MAGGDEPRRATRRDVREAKMKTVSERFFPRSKKTDRNRVPRERRGVAVTPRARAAASPMRSRRAYLALLGASLALVALRQLVVSPPSPRLPVPSRRRALTQIARESETQRDFDFLPGTSGPGPTYWMLRDYAREVPAAEAERAILTRSNAMDAAWRSNAKRVTPGQVILLPSTLNRLAAAPWEWAAATVGLEPLGQALAWFGR